MDIMYYLNSTILFFVLGGVLLIIEYLIAHALLALLRKVRGQKHKKHKFHFLKITSVEFVLALILSYANGFIFYFFLLPHLPFLQDTLYRSM